MNPEIMKISTGYVGAMGMSWRTPTAEEVEKAIGGAIKIEGLSRDEIVTMLEAGETIRWCQSPNFCYDHSYGKLVTKQQTTTPSVVRCDCGHEIESRLVMNASLGTSCPDCYDRMSDQ